MSSSRHRLYRMGGAIAAAVVCLLLSAPPGEAAQQPGQS